MSRFYIPLNFILLGLLLAGVYFISPFFIIPASFIGLLSLLSNSSFTASSITLINMSLVNSIFYFFDVKLELFTQKIETCFIIILTYNILNIIFNLISLKYISKKEDAFQKDIIDKFSKEKDEFIKNQSNINHKLKDYKLEMSQKMSIVKKLMQSFINKDKDINDNIISSIKNVLNLEKFIYFTYSKEKNSFVKSHEEYVDISSLKNSLFLRWVIERARNFPANINILTKENISKSPEFSSIYKKDKSIPDIFIPVKNGGTLTAFIIAYTDKKSNDNDFRALAQLLSQTLSFIESSKIR